MRSADINRKAMGLSEKARNDSDACFADWIATSLAYKIFLWQAELLDLFQALVLFAVLCYVYFFLLWMFFSNLEVWCSHKSLK